VLDSWLNSRFEKMNDDFKKAEIRVDTPIATASLRARFSKKSANFPCSIRHHNGRRMGQGFSFF